MKENLIKNIKRIIEEYGSFSTFDVDSESSPVVGTLGSAFMLAEHFNLHTIDGYLYLNGDENERDIEEIRYEDLSEECLGEIEILAQHWEADNIQTEKRISN